MIADALLLSRWSPCAYTGVGCLRRRTPGGLSRIRKRSGVGIPGRRLRARPRCSDATRARPHIRDQPARSGLTRLVVGLTNAVAAVSARAGTPAHSPRRAASSAGDRTKAVSWGTGRAATLATRRVMWSGSRGVVPTPTATPDAQPASAPAAVGVFTGGGTTLRLTTVRGLKCWGFEGNDRLGDGTTTNRASAGRRSGAYLGRGKLMAGTMRAVRALIGHTFRIYKERFFMIVPIAAIAQVPYILGLLVESAYGPETPVTFLLDIVSSVLLLGMYGAVAHVVAQHIAQPTVNAGEAYRRAVQRLLPMIGVEIITVVLGGTAIIVGLFLALQLPFASFMTKTIVLGVAVVLVAVYVGVRLFAVLAIVLFGT